MGILQMTATGNLGRDAERRQTGKGTTVLNFSVAAERYDGQQNVTEWLDCALFGKRADGLAPYLTKGTKVTITGTPTARGFTDRGGNVRAAINVMVDEIALQGGGQNQSRDTPRQAPGPGGGDDMEDDIPF